MTGKRQKLSLRISSLNCRSLSKHFLDIASDEILKKSDMITLQETWLEYDISLDDLQLPNYKLHVVSAGRGKGIAIYYKEKLFAPLCDVKKENVQLSKFSCHYFDVISLYRSQDASYAELNKKLSLLIDRRKSTLIIGDFNFCYIESTHNISKNFLLAKKFKQIIEKPTHVDGKLIDQVYLKDVNGNLKVQTFLHSKYYSHHKGPSLILGTGTLYSCLIFYYSLNCRNGKLITCS